jgi:hypothetical protein
LIAGGVLAIGMAFKIIGSVDMLSVIALSIGVALITAAFSQLATMQDSKGNPISFKQILYAAAILPIMSLGLLGSGLILKQVPIFNITELLSIVGVGLAIGAATMLLFMGIDKLKANDIKMIFLLPVILPLIAGGIYLSSIILAQVNTDINFLGLIGTSIAIGVSILAMVPVLWGLKQAGLLDPKAIKDLAIGLVTIPLIALAIALSSWVISLGTYDDNYPTWEWALGVGISIIAFSIPVIAIGALMIASGGVGYAAIGAGLLALPLIALAIVAVSYILPLGDYSQYPPLVWAIGTSMLMLSFAAVMVATGLLLPFLMIGTLSVLVITGAIVAASYLLQLGDYSKTIPYKWIFNTIFAIGGFGVMMSPLGALLPVILLGLPSILIISEAIQLASHILAKGDYGNYPKFKWAFGVGASIVAFGVPMAILGAAILSSLGLALEALQQGMGAILLIADTLQLASHILAKGNYDVYPTAKWASGVGMAIAAFATSIFMLKRVGIDVVASDSIWTGKKQSNIKEAFSNIVGALVAAGKAFSGSAGIFDPANVPSEEWADGVGGAISAFAISINLLKRAGINVVDTDSIWTGKKSANINEAFTNIVGALIAAGIAFSGSSGVFDPANVPGEEWAKGVGGSITAFAVAINELKKAGINVVDTDSFWTGPKQSNIQEAFANIVGALIAAGHAFANSNGAFDPSTVPSSEWAKGVGGSLSAFAIAINELKKAGIDVVATDSFWTGKKDSNINEAFVNIVGALIAAGHAFANSDGAFDPSTVPSSEWAKGVGGAITAFAISIDLLKKSGVNVVDSQGSWFTADKSANIRDAFVNIADALIAVGYRFNVPGLFSLDNVPSPQWAKGVMDALTLFANPPSGGFKNMINAAIIEKTMEIILNIAVDFARISALGVPFKMDLLTKSIRTMVEVLPKQSEITPLFYLISALNKLGDINFKDLIKLSTVSESIGYLALQIKKINEDKVRSLSELAANLHVISLVDEERLRSTLSVIEDKSNAISSIMDDGGTMKNMFDNIKTQISGANLSEQTENKNLFDSHSRVLKPGEKNVETVDDKILKHVANIDTNLDKFVNKTKEELEKEERMGSRNVEDSVNNFFNRG